MAERNGAVGLYPSLRWLRSRSDQTMIVEPTGRHALAAIAPLRGR